MLGEPESWAPPSAAQRLRSSSEAETSSVAALLPSCPGHRSPFPVEGGGGCSDDRGGGGWPTGFAVWRQPQHRPLDPLDRTSPSLCGRREGLEWGAGSECRWATGMGQLCREQSTSVWVTVAGAPPHNLSAQPASSQMRYGLRWGLKWGKGRERKARRPRLELGAAEGLRSYVKKSVLSSGGGEGRRAMCKRKGKGSNRICSGRATDAFSWLQSAPGAWCLLLCEAARPSPPH